MFTIERVLISEVIQLQSLSRQTFFETFSDTNSKENMDSYLNTNLSLDKLKLQENTQSLLNNIVANFIKKKMKLTNLNGTLEIRKFIYTLLSININLVEFIKCLIQQLLASKINSITKQKIIEKTGIFSSY